MNSAGANPLSFVDRLAVLVSGRLRRVRPCEARSVPSDSLARKQKWSEAQTVAAQDGHEARSSRNPHPAPPAVGFRLGRSSIVDHRGDEAYVLGGGFAPRMRRAAFRR